MGQLERTCPAFSPRKGVRAPRWLRPTLRARPDPAQACACAADLGLRALQPERRERACALFSLPPIHPSPPTYFTVSKPRSLTRPRRPQPLLRDPGRSIPARVLLGQPGGSGGCGGDPAPAETQAGARPPAIGDCARSPGAALPSRASVPGSRCRRHRARAAQVKEEKKGGKNRKRRPLQQRSAAGLGQAERRTPEPAIQGRGGGRPGRAGFKKKKSRRRRLREGGPRAACSERGSAALHPGA